MTENGGQFPMPKMNGYVTLTRREYRENPGKCDKSDAHKETHNDADRPSPTPKVGVQSGRSAGLLGGGLEGRLFGLLALLCLSALGCTVEPLWRPPADGTPIEVAVVDPSVTVDQLAAIEGAAARWNEQVGAPVFYVRWEPGTHACARVEVRLVDMGAEYAGTEHEGDGGLWTRSVCGGHIELDRQGSPANFATRATHELGHALGLYHDDLPGSVMAPNPDEGAGILSMHVASVVELLGLEVP